MRIKNGNQAYRVEKKKNDDSGGDAPRLSLHVGDVGGQHHVRLLRALQIIQSLTDGNSHSNTNNNVGASEGKKGPRW